MVFDRGGIYRRLGAALGALLVSWSALAAQAEPVGSAAGEEATLMALLDDRTPLKVGDRLQYTVVEDRTPPLALFLDERGEVDIPLVGRVRAAGVTARRLAEDVKRQLEVDFYYHATVLIQVQPDNVRGRITVLGPVVQEGAQNLATGELLTLSQAVLRAGGFAEGANRAQVAIIRRDPDTGSESRQVHDVGRMLATGNFSGDPILEPDDVVLIPRTGEIGGKVFIVGAVTSPGLYDLPRDGPFTVSRAILQAGGFTKFADRRRVKLIRNDPSLGERDRTQVINVADILERGRGELDLPVRADDIVRVEERWIAW